VTFFSGLFLFLGRASCLAPAPLEHRGKIFLFLAIFGLFSLFFVCVGGRLGDLPGCFIHRFCTVFSPVTHGHQPPATGVRYRLATLGGARILRAQWAFRRFVWFSFLRLALVRLATLGGGRTLRALKTSRNACIFLWVLVGCPA